MSAPLLVVLIFQLKLTLVFIFQLTQYFAYFQFQVYCVQAEKMSCTDWCGVGSGGHYNINTSWAVFPQRGGLATHTVSLRAAGLLLTGGPSKFSSTPPKVTFSWLIFTTTRLCVHLHAHMHVRHCQAWKTSCGAHILSNTHLIYNLLKKVEHIGVGNEYWATNIYRASYRISAGFTAKWTGSDSWAEKQKGLRCHWKQNEWSKQTGCHPRCNSASQDLNCLQAHEFLNGKYLPPTKSPLVLLDVLLSASLPFST